VPTDEAPTVVFQGARRWRVDARPLQRAVAAALRAGAPRVRGEVTVVLTGDRAIRRLNRDFRGKDRATDVLSFRLGDGRAAGEPFGDVVVSVETARRQARDYEATLVEELQRLLVHGVLHLCGFDHQERREAARMHALTRKLLRELGRVDHKGRRLHGTGSPGGRRD
jgi:rRNA maturation RNase YbeY